jgi:predicted metal-dependent peptidase
MNKLTAEQRIERTHVQLMRDKNFCLFSGVFMVGKVTISETVPTACTDGRNVTYGRAFVDRLNDKQLAFLVIHEAMHKAYRHMMVWKKIAKENANLANMAMDYVINLQIQDYDPQGNVIEMPRDENGKIMGLIDEKYRGMDTAQVYEILKKECKDKGKGNGKGKGDGKDGGQPDTPSGGQGGEGGGDEPYEFDEHDWEGASDLTEEEEQELGNEIDHALREGAILAGKMKGNMPRGIQELLHPKVDWKEAMRDFVKAHTKGLDESTWRKPHRKYLGMDIIMPSTIGFKAERVAIGTDTSGSIGGDLIGRFLGEVKLICDDVEPEIVDMLYWDSHVAKHEVYAGAEVSNLIASTRPTGGGGTEPDCVPTYLVKHGIKPQCLVMLTDGEFFGHNTQKWDELGVPVLWCVVGNSHFTPKIGQAVCVE